MRRIPLVLAAAAAFLSMAVVFLLKPLADTAFLSVYGAAHVPHFTVAEAALVIVTSAGYGRLLRRGTFLVIDLALLSLLAAAAALAPLALARGGPWVFASALALNALAALANIAVWNAVTSVVRGRSARAFVSRAGAAATAGAVIGGFLASAVVAALDLAWLGYVALLPIATLMALQTVLMRAGRSLTSRAGRRPAQAAQALPPGVARRLVRVTAIAAAVSAVLTVVVDLGFKAALDARLDRQAMGVFFSFYYGISNVLVLIMQLAGTARLLATRPLRLTLSLQPVAMLVALLAWIVAPGLVLATLARGAESILKFGVSRPAQEVALLPLSERRRSRAKVLIRGVIGQGGSAAAGLGLIALAPWLLAMPWRVPAVAAALALVWLWLQRRAGRLYLETLGSALGMRRVLMGRPRPEDPTEAPVETLLDQDGIARVIAMLASPDADTARLGRELLAVALPDVTVLEPALGHDSAAVRRAIYQRLAVRPDLVRTASLRAAMSAAVMREPAHSPALAAGLDALAAVGDTAIVGWARELALIASESVSESVSVSVSVSGSGSESASGSGSESASGSVSASGSESASASGSEPASASGSGSESVSASGSESASGSASASAPVQHAAHAYLAQVGALDAQPAQLAAVLAAVVARDGVRAAALFRAACDRGCDQEPLERVILDAMDGHDPAQAYRAAAAIGRMRMLVPLLKALDGPGSGIEQTLAHLDATGLANLIMLVNARHAGVRVRVRVLRGLRGNLHAGNAAEIVRLAAGMLAHSDPDVRDAAVRTLLRRLRDGEDDIPRAPVIAALDAALDRFHLYVHARTPYPSQVHESNVAFRHGLASAAESVLARTLTASPQPGDTAALRFATSGELFFLDELERRTEQALTRVCELLALLDHPDEVFAAARELRAPGLKRRLKAVDILQEVAPRVQRGRLFDLLDRYLRPRPTEAGARQAVCAQDPWLARCLSDELAPIRHRLSGLRAAPLFDEVPGEVLVELAARVTEETRAAGDVVVHQGQAGDTLYILLRGKLDVELDGRQVAQLHMGQYFGELALIDGRPPRRATVRAATPVRLLCLPRGPFLEALASRAEIRLGLMRGLARWLRSVR